LYESNVEVIASRHLLSRCDSAKDSSAGAHLESLNQPRGYGDDESDTSIGSSQLFDAPEALVHTPLLAAALKAKEDSHPQFSAQDMPSKGISAEAHLEGLNQPSGSGGDDESDNSIGSSQLFDAPKPMVYKPLLAAALKAKGYSSLHPQTALQYNSVNDVSAGAHLEGLNQPTSCGDDESVTSIGSSQLFHAPKLSVPKPLLAAALKTKGDSKSQVQASVQHEFSQGVSTGAHLDGLNQPKGNDESDTSIESSEFFDAITSSAHKPLLAAAKKTKGDSKSHLQASEQHPFSKDDCSAAHLEGLNLPRSYGDDESDISIGSSQLFDAPRAVAHKPLLAAALKAPGGSEPAKRFL
jgi:hypothetical protein